MEDYPDQIKAFIKQFFNPALPMVADLKLSTKELLTFLFRSFPQDCITEYDLADILHELGYSQQLYTVTRIEGEGENAREKTSLQTGWCLASYYSLS